MLVRILLILACLFAVLRSARLAWADLMASRGTLEGLDRALRIEPSDVKILTLAAEYRSNSGDASPEVDRVLTRASRLNPLDSSIPMALGIRAESRGNNAAAERYLVHAAEIDHQFKPAWTLANFYVRTDHPERAWPLISRVLNLNPLGFDPVPVFNLCWAISGNSKQILGAMPHGRPRIIQYLQYLMQTGRVEAALEAWPLALGVMDSHSEDDTGTISAFPAFLAGKGRVPEAVDSWNRLISRGVLHSGRLDPAEGRSIADPEFSWRTPPNGGFGWEFESTPGVFLSGVTPTVRVELDGTEAEDIRIATILAPLVPARKYRLVWKADGSRLSAHQDPGFMFRIMQAGSALAACPPLLQVDGPGSCKFANAPEKDQVRIDLMYKRAPGTTRAEGSLLVEEVNLEFDN